MLSSDNMSSLSLSQYLWIVTFMLKESAAGYNKIIVAFTTELELDSFSIYYIIDDQLTS